MTLTQEFFSKRGRQEELEGQVLLVESTEFSSHEKTACKKIHKLREEKKKAKGTRVGEWVEAFIHVSKKQQREEEAQTAAAPSGKAPASMGVCSPNPQLQGVNV